MSSITRLATVIVVLLLPFTTACRSSCQRSAEPTPVDLVQRDADRLFDLYERARAGEATLKEGLGLFKELYQGKRLKPAVGRFVDDLVARSPTAQGLLKHKDYFAELIGAELCIRGVLPQCSGITYEPWDKIAARHDALITEGDAGSLANATTITDIARFAGADFRGAAAVEMLIDGPASWAKRAALMADAEHSIDVITWAFYDDHTGWESARALAQRAKDGIQVRVMFDARVATHAPYKKVADWLREQAKKSGGSLQVIGWKDAARPYDGQHRKMLIVDREHVVAGGLNYGDWYSHQNPDEPQRWRDTDVYVKGHAAVDAARVFHSLWNEQIKGRYLDLPLNEFPNELAATNDGLARVAVVTHQAGHDEHILLSLLRTIEAAQTSIDIETAYFISIPSLDSALRRAIKRGVKVRLLTNSADSVDETLITSAILTTAKALSDAGAEVYLRRGSTLHSKFLIIDGMFTSVGSYNLHPRSYRMEGEVMFHILGAKPAADLTRAFEKDLEASDRISPNKPLVIPSNPLTALALRFFPDQL